VPTLEGARRGVAEDQPRFARGTERTHAERRGQRVARHRQGRRQRLGRGAGGLAAAAFDRRSETRADSQVGRRDLRNRRDARLSLARDYYWLQRAARAQGRATRREGRRRYPPVYN